MHRFGLALLVLALGVLVSLGPFVWADVGSGFATMLFLLWSGVPFLVVAYKVARGAGRRWTAFALPLAAAGTVLGQLGTLETGRPTLQLALIVLPLVAALLLTLEPHAPRSRAASRRSAPRSGLGRGRDRS